MDHRYIVLAAIWFGIVLRIAVPAARKYLELLKAGEPFHWSHFYTGALIFGVLVSIPITFLAFAAFSIPPDTDALSLFIAGTVWGIGQQELIVEVMNWALA